MRKESRLVKPGQIRTPLRILIAVLLLGAVLYSGGSALAQVGLPTVDRWAFGSGGGVQTAGSITLDGTFGQMVIGESAGGKTGISAGYWNTLPSTNAVDEMVFLPFVRK